VKLNLTASYTAQTSVILCVPSDFLFYLSLLTDAIRYSAPLRSLTRVPLPLPSPRFQLAPPTTMGNCTSTSDCQAKAHSDAIDKEIENDSKKFRKECKILLLGALAFYSWLSCSVALLASLRPSFAHHMGGCVLPTMLRSTLSFPVRRCTS
jgi:hypothetical protein